MTGRHSNLEGFDLKYWQMR